MSNETRMCDIHKNKPALWKVRTERSIVTTKTITTLKTGANQIVETPPQLVSPPTEQYCCELCQNKLNPE